MGSLSVEVRVGAFVVVALGLLVAFVLVLGDFSFRPGYRLYTDFAYSGGLQVGAPVKVSGIRVGKVADLVLIDNAADPAPATSENEVGRAESPVVRATLSLDLDAKPLLTRGSRFFVGMQGVIGEAYLEISPGPRGAPVLEEDSSIRGVDAPRLHVMALQLSSVLRTIAAFGAGTDGEVEELAGALASLVRSIDSVVTERRSELSGAVADAAVIMADLKEVIAKIRTAVGDGRALEQWVEQGGALAATMERELPLVLARATQSMSALEAVANRAGEAVDPRQIGAILADMHETVQHLRQTALDAQHLVNTIRRGQGSVGGLVTDPQIYDDLKEVLRDVKRNPWKLFWRD